MYNGDEKLISDGVYLPYTMLNFWQWSLSNIQFGMTRGTFADFIVRCSLDSGGIITRPDIGTGFEPYDLEGPVIPSTGRVSRIEVKSSAYLNSETCKYSERASFSIAPARVPIDGDYKKDSPQQRNNDLYVFCLYTATDNRRNILDLSWWEFFVLPTYRIEENKNLCKQKTISIKRVKELCPTLSFDMLCNAIVESCNSIPANSQLGSTPPRTSVQFCGVVLSRYALLRWRLFHKNRLPPGIETVLLACAKYRNIPDDFSPGYSCRLWEEELHGSAFG